MLVLQACLQDANFLLKTDHQNSGKKKPEIDSRIILKCILWKCTWQCIDGSRTGLFRDETKTDCSHSVSIMRNHNLRSDEHSWMFGGCTVLKCDQRGYEAMQVCRQEPVLGGLCCIDLQNSFYEFWETSGSVSHQ